MAIRIAGVKLAGAAAMQLTSDASIVSEVVIQADPDNTEALFIGSATTRPIQLNAGASITIPERDASKIYVSSAGGTANANFLAVD